MSEYIAETISEIIEELVYNHFIRHFEIVSDEHRQNIRGKPSFAKAPAGRPFANRQAEYKFLEGYRPDSCENAR